MNCKNNLNEFFLGIANATFMNYENAEGQEMDEKELLVIIPAYNEEKNIGFVNLVKNLKEDPTAKSTADPIWEEGMTAAKARAGAVVTIRI